MKVTPNTQRSHMHTAASISVTFKDAFHMNEEHIFNVFGYLLSPFKSLSPLQSVSLILKLDITRALWESTTVSMRAAQLRSMPCLLAQFPPSRHDHKSIHHPKGEQRGAMRGHSRLTSLPGDLTVDRPCWKVNNRQACNREDADMHAWHHISLAVFWHLD